MTLQPYAAPVLTGRSALAPAEALATWLEAHPGVVLRVPVQVEASPLGLSSGAVGALQVRLDDAALGISLADRVRDACPEGGACTVWLDGTWVPAGGDGPGLRVLHFHRAAKAGEPVDFLEFEAAATR